MRTTKKEFECNCPVNCDDYRSHNKKINAEYKEEQKKEAAVRALAKEIRASIPGFLLEGEPASLLLEVENSCRKHEVDYLKVVAQIRRDLKLEVYDRCAAFGLALGGLLTSDQPDKLELAQAFLNNGMGLFTQKT